MQSFVSIRYFTSYFIQYVVKIVEPLIYISNLTCVLVLIQNWQKIRNYEKMTTTTTVLQSFMDDAIAQSKKEKKGAISLTGFCFLGELSFKN